MPASDRSAPGVPACGPPGAATPAQVALGQLHARVDAFFARVRRRHGAYLACRAGCDACCQQTLTLFDVEVDRLLEAIEARGDEVVAIVARALQAGDDPALPCPLLHAGRCLVYAARPVVCRSHGLVVQVSDAGVLRRDACPRNFRGGGGIAAVPAQDVLDLDRLDLVLAAVAECAHPGGGRTNLRGALRRWLARRASSAAPPADRARDQSLQ